MKKKSICAPSSRQAKAFFLGGLLLLTVAVTWLFAHEGHAPLPTKGAQVDVAKGRIILAQSAREALDVQTAEVEVRPVDERTLAYTMLTTPWQAHAYASSRLPGKIVKMNVRPGQTVAAGEVLAEVQSLELESMRLEVRNGLNEARLSQKVLETLRQAPQSVPGQEIQDAETKLQQSLNALEVARSKWLSLGLDIANLDTNANQGKQEQLPTLPIRSPVRGVVIHADLTVGRVIEPAEHLFEIIDLRTIWARIDVLEKDLHKVDVGQPVELSLAAYPGEVFRTTIHTRGFALDPASHLVSFWAEFTNPAGRTARFVPGMHGQAQVIHAFTKGAKVIPSDALVEDGLDHYVLVEEAKTAKASEFQKRHVAVKRRGLDWVEIQSGELFPGDRVVTRGSHELASFFVPGTLRLSAETKQTIGLRVEVAQRRTVETVLSIDGAVEVPPDRRNYASAQLAGALEKIHVDRGQAVQKGQVLAEVASLEFQNLQLALLKEHLDVQLLDKQYQPLRKSDDVVSRRRLFELESGLVSARNRKESLARRLEILGLTQEQLDRLLMHKKVVELMPIRATVAGTVVHFDRVLGQAVKAEEKLFTLHDLTRPWVEGFISEGDLGKIRIGQPVRVRFTSAPETIHVGTITRSGNIFGPESRTLSLWVELDTYPNKPLLHGQLARLSVTLKQHAPSLAVPLSAVIHEGTRSYVFIQQDDGVFGRVPVILGPADDRFVDIRSGLEEGQRVVVQGAAQLQTAYASIR